MYPPELHHLNNLPQLDLIQVLNSQNNISNLDPDLNIPSQLPPPQALLIESSNRCGRKFRDARAV